jgi:hypothetical protein
MFLGQTVCGKLILDSNNSRLEVDVSLIKEAIKHSSLSEATNVATFSYKFKKTVGYNIVVPASSNDEIVFAKRPGKEFISRFVQNKKPLPTAFICLEIYKFPGSSNEWLLRDSYFGNTRVPEILIGTKGTTEQKRYWDTRAFVWGYCSVVPGTVSKTCPWEF